MPSYSEKAQPFLDAIASGVFTSKEVRNWMIKGTVFENAYHDASVLFDEQRDLRWRKRPTKQPFWANYWCGKDTRCVCRIPGSSAIESDAIFFLRNKIDRVLAIHVEFKHPKEPFRFGQPDSYPLRAECFSRTYKDRATLNPHHDWTTVLFCGSETFNMIQPRFFQRVISHEEARLRIQNYPEAV